MLQINVMLCDLSYSMVKRYDAMWMCDYYSPHAMIYPAVWWSDMMLCECVTIIHHMPWFILQYGEAIWCYVNVWLLFTTCHDLSYSMVKRYDAMWMCDYYSPHAMIYPTVWWSDMMLWLPLVQLELWTFKNYPNGSVGGTRDTKILLANMPLYSLLNVAPCTCGNRSVICLCWTTFGIFKFKKPHSISRCYRSTYLDNISETCFETQVTKIIIWREARGMQHGMVSFSVVFSQSKYQKPHMVQAYFVSIFSVLSVIWLHATISKKVDTRKTSTPQSMTRSR